MSEYRNRTTGVVKTQGQWRNEFANMSLPRVWKAATLDALDLDPVLKSPAATVGDYQVSVRDGVVQDANGNWVENYVARDMFADTTEDGVTTTKAEHEAAYQATLDTRTAEANRATRDSKLAETDFYALSDVTMSAEMTTYRQALRDITAHENWPNLEDADWPTKP
jgi:D-tyrosyl-tRNA(Tyr) deacylase